MATMSSPVPRTTGRTQQYGAAISRIRFRRAIALALMTMILPGSAQLAVGNKKVGWIAIRTVLGLALGLALVGLVAAVFNSLAFWLLTNTFVLGLIRFGLIGLAIGWAYLFVDAWRLGDPLSMERKQRLAIVSLNSALCLALVGSLLYASHVVGVQKSLIANMFGASAVSNAHDGRFNVLLLGGDSGSDRWGLRADSINVASIDEETGRTVLFGLPRNMLNFPFAKGSIMDKQFPNGYNCGSECELNSLATYAADHKDLFRKYRNPGVEATIEAVEGITGLRINYWAMVNLRGFEKLVDAVGGVKLRVRDRIPIGGVGAPITGYIEPGHKKLNGFQTLWFARSRAAADDYSRMARQKCVMSAMLTQLSPQTVVTKFGDIAAASEDLVSTNLPASQLSTFIPLALKAKNQKIKTVSFVPPQINTGRPDIKKIQQMVRTAIDPPRKKATPDQAPSGSTATTPAGTGSTSGSIGNIRDGYAANQSKDLAGSC
ncbi:MAG TPA: LCP family protein [Marmoricola sp.]|nr:LCP family protein [Marmoricola sp.]HNJ78506.1 LCP family protein [Marmoricola sp.]